MSLAMSSVWHSTPRGSLLVSEYERYVCTMEGRKNTVGVGFTNGVVGVLDSLTLEDSCQPFCFSREGITHITFSQDSRYIATAVSHSIHTAGKSKGR